MAGESTYYYFQYEQTNLASQYGGGAIVTDAGSFDTTPLDFCQRRLMATAGIPAKGTRYLSRQGLVAGVSWLRMTPELYAICSAGLMASEAATVTTTMPVGFVLNSSLPVFIPSGTAINFLAVGDSITEGTGSTDTVETCWLAQMLPLLDTGVIAVTGSGRMRFGKRWAGINLGQGSSSFANPYEFGLGESGYQKRLDLNFNQRFRTLPLNNCKLWMHLFLGTNDIAYATIVGTPITADTAWQREKDLVTRIRAQFPNIFLSTSTSIRRLEGATPNNIIRAKNDLQIANYVSAGIDMVIDIERNAHPDFNCVTGNTTLTGQCYAGVNGTTGLPTTDNIHPSNFGYLKIAQYIAAQAPAIVAARGW